MSYPSIAALPVRVVLTDANVLYSRVLRDYLLYAADQGLISITWSAEILDEMTEHLTPPSPACQALPTRRPSLRYGEPEPRPPPN